MIGAFKTIFETVAGVGTALRDTFGEPVTMPLDGDRVFLGETAASGRQAAGAAAENARKSSPVRRATTRSAGGYAQGFHRTGNPPGAHKIVLGGVRPQNNLNAQRGAIIASHHHSPATPPRKRPRPSQPQLRYTGSQGRGNPRSSPPLEFTENMEEAAAFSNDESTNMNGLYSPGAGRGFHGHAELSPQPFERAGRSDRELLPAAKIEDTAKWVGRGQGARDSINSMDVGSSKKRPAAEEVVPWNARSTSDPQPTNFKRTRQIASSPIPTSSRGLRDIQPAGSKCFLRLKTAWRGRISLNSSTTCNALTVRIEDKGISVVIATSLQEELSTYYENIEFAVYCVDTNPEFRNFVHLKLKNRDHNLPERMLFEFRALQEPADPNQKPDAARFVQWLREHGVQIEQKTHTYMQKRMDETKQHQFSKGAMAESSGAPWQNPAPIRVNRPLAPKPQTMELEGRPRTRSNPVPPDGFDSNWASLKQFDLSKPLPALAPPPATRKSTRTATKKEAPVVVPPPKPLFPWRNWKHDLRFPFEARGPSEILSDASLRTLNYDEFLNDEIINFHLNIVKARLAKDQPELAAKVHIMNTYLYPAFSAKPDKGQFSYDKVKRWTKNANLFEKDLIFIPINEKFHWLVAVVCNFPAALAAAKARERKADLADELIAIEPTQKKPAPNRPIPAGQCTVAILDSMAGYNISTLRTIKSYLIAEAKDKQGVTLGMDDFSGVNPRKLPGQDNFSDCGIFMLHYIEKWLSAPAKIKEKVYERDFGSEEDARKLWGIQEVTSKREKMWRLYMKLYEEYEKCMNKEPFTEFPEIDDAPIEYAPRPAGEGPDVMIIDQTPDSPSVSGAAVTPEAVERPNSPTKRKSDGKEEETDRPSKRARSDSPVVVVEQPRKTTTLGPKPKPRVASPEIPANDDVPCVLEVPETQESFVEVVEDLSILGRAEALLKSNLPLVAANGLVPLPVPNGLTQESMHIHERIEQLEGFGPTLEKQSTAASPELIDIDTPSMVTAASFDDLSIESSLGYQDEPKGTTAKAGITLSDTPTPPPPSSRRTVEEIEETEDESIGEMKYNGGRGRGKSMHELANDQIMDIPSSQDHKEPTPQESHEPQTPIKGTAHDPICIDSQSSPKRTSPRTKAGNRTARA
ncbi:hypothetical protein TWF730_009421 [Orbilia blumenaviensis]|uniref:Ubiquitin-like protease family profile domain-containing protein n=1 Tax=Orbilia blumenaviensis TaxID=1796055 RepID=A0AAV9UZT9_9PEZI